jgi:hypothetical protein
MTNPLGQGPAQSYSQGQNCRRSLQTLDIYGLFLKSSGLYVLQDIAQAKFPMTLVDLKSHGIDSLIKAVKTYQEMALEIHSINGKNEQGSSGKKKKTQDDSQEQNSCLHCS